MDDAVPEKGIDVMEALISKYSLAKDESTDSMLGGTIEFLDSRIGQVSRNLKSIESSVEQYKLKNKSK